MDILFLFNYYTALKYVFSRINIFLSCTDSLKQFLFLFLFLFCGLVKAPGDLRSSLFGELLTEAK